MKGAKRKGEPLTTEMMINGISYLSHNNGSVTGPNNQGLSAVEMANLCLSQITYFSRTGTAVDFFRGKMHKVWTGLEPRREVLNNFELEGLYLFAEATGETSVMEDIENFMKAKGFSHLI